MTGSFAGSDYDAGFVPDIDFAELRFWNMKVKENMTDDGNHNELQAMRMWLHAEGTIRFATDYCKLYKQGYRMFKVSDSSQMCRVSTPMPPKLPPKMGLRARRNLSSVLETPSFFRGITPPSSPVYPSLHCSELSGVDMVMDTPDRVDEADGMFKFGMRVQLECDTGPSKPSTPAGKSQQGRGSSEAKRSCEEEDESTTPKRKPMRKLRQRK